MHTTQVRHQSQSPIIEPSLTTTACGASGFHGKYFSSFRRWSSLDHAFTAEGSGTAETHSSALGRAPERRHAESHSIRSSAVAQELRICPGSPQPAWPSSQRGSWVLSAQASFCSRIFWLYKLLVVPNVSLRGQYPGNYFINIALYCSRYLWNETSETNKIHTGPIYSFMLASS